MTLWHRMSRRVLPGPAGLMPVSCQQQQRVPVLSRRRWCTWRCLGCVLVAIALVYYLLLPNSAWLNRQQQQQQQQLDDFLNQNAVEHEFDFVYEFANLSALDIRQAQAQASTAREKHACFNTTTDRIFLFCLPESLQSQPTGIYSQVKEHGVWRREIGIALRNAVGAVGRLHQGNVTLVVVDALDWTFQTQLMLANNLSVLVTSADGAALQSLSVSLQHSTSRPALTVLPYSVRGRVAGSVKLGIAIPPVPRWGSIQLNDLIPWLKARSVVLYLSHHNTSCQAMRGGYRLLYKLSVTHIVMAWHAKLDESPDCDHVKQHLADRDFVVQYIDTRLARLPRPWPNIDRTAHLLWVKRADPT